MAVNPTSDHADSAGVLPEASTGTLFGVPRIASAVASSRSGLIGLITLAMKCAGARSAGNPHATCDVAGAGKGATATPKRARRGKPRIQAKEKPAGHRPRARPHHPMCPRPILVTSYLNYCPAYVNSY